MDSNARTRSARYVFISILALMAVLVGVTGDKFLPITVDQNPVANTARRPIRDVQAEAQATRDPLAADPAPPLLDAGDLRTVGSVIKKQKATADALIARWWAENGNGTVRRGIRLLGRSTAPAGARHHPAAGRAGHGQALGGSRDPAGDKAADWLNEHGCEDVWMSFTKEQVALRSTTDDEAKAEEVNTVLKLASEVASAAQDRTGSPAASQPKPCSGATKPARSDCSCSYPSTQATMSAAARAYLSKLSPYREDQYRWMESQVDLAALYAGLELPSDIGSGALLGELVGQYVLVTRGHAKP